jgi:hypothetical protein
MPESPACAVIWILHASRRPCGVPGHFDHATGRAPGNSPGLGRFGIGLTQQMLQVAAGPIGADFTWVEPGTAIDL